MDSSDDKKKTVTQDDVAKLAGVSRSVVSYVINRGGRPVAPETKQKILNAIETLGYRPNQAAQNLTKSKYDLVADKQFGIILSDVFMLKRPYYADILAGIHNTAHENFHHIRFIRFFNELKDPLLFDELIHEEKISGLILIALDQSIETEEDQNIIINIQDRIKNMVTIEWTLDGVPSVIFSRRDAAYKACSYLISRGKKDIVYVGPEDERFLGFQQALIEADLFDNIKNAYYGSDLKDGYNQCNILINHSKIPEAILGGTDEVSIGILRGLHENKLRVPDDISLVSIDNIEMAEFTSPPLTTVNVETWEMGSSAVSILMQRAKNPNSLATTTLIPTKLVIRESCV
ncbi:MAG: LacI family DNA-binding transcriptional regulator [Spirochaetales bacterium]|nr:LacI family DNA-binding transcriptional regulator [Spirochaetales bacterium]